MFLRATTREKDGKEHHYWSVVENRRVGGGRVAQRHVLNLGEISRCITPGEFRAERTPDETIVIEIP